MAPSIPKARRLDIDNLRNIAVLALILFHTARLFDNDEWHVKDAAVYEWANWIIWILNQTHMPLFFLLAGASAYYAIQAKGAGWFTRERFLRLFIPLVLGSILLVSPQVYIERISSFVTERYVQTNFDGSFIEFFPSFFTTGAYPEGNFSWHHLWFICYLFVYSVALAVPLATLGRGRAGAVVGGSLSRGFLFLALPMAVIVAIHIGLYPIYGSTHNLVRDWANHAHYVFVFLMGWAIVAGPALEQAVIRCRRLSLGIAVVTSVLWIYSPIFESFVPKDEVLRVRYLMYFVGEWPWLLALVGYARVLLDRRIPFLTGFTRYAFPFYILHQTVIVILGYQLWNWSDQPVLKYAVIAVATTAISLIGCRLFDTNPVTRFVIGLKSPPPRAAA